MRISICDKYDCRIISILFIQEYGLVVMGEEENGEDVDHAVEEDDDVDDLSPRKLSVKKVLVSQEVGELLSKGAARGSLGMFH